MSSYEKKKEEEERRKKELEVAETFRRLKKTYEVYFLEPNRTQ